jgi:Uma2 family endonuclease
MGETGIIGADERVELLDGQLIKMPPMGERHWSFVSRIHRVLAQRTLGRATVVAQLPVVVTGDSEPVPDVSVLRYDPRDYEDGKPSIADIFLLVEVSDSSLALDRTTKLHLYERARVPAYWILNVREKTVVSYRDPRAEGYRLVREHARGAYIDLPGFPDVLLTVDELF